MSKNIQDPAACIACNPGAATPLSRRAFLRRAAVLSASGIVLLSPHAWAARSLDSSSKRRLIVVFLRGAVDGLNVVVPHGESAYYDARPTIAIGRMGAGDGVIDLDGYFGLHPALAPMVAQWRDGTLAFVHACGSPDPTRSHFDAQDFMESGTPGVKATEDGWLDRALQTMPEEHASPFRAVAMGPNLPRMLQGSTGAIALPDLKQFKIMPQSAAMNNVAQGGFEAMYSQSVDHALHGTGAETFEAIEMLGKIDTSKFPPENGAVYPNNRLGQSLQQIGQLIKAKVGVEVLFVDCGGWDNHVNEGGAQGQLSNLLKDLGQGLAAFHQDMGDRMGDIVVVTMSEFGRTAKENGNRGTDHGHANCMFVMGGDVKGGQVYGKWPGLADHQLNEGRDLALTTDFRTVVSEILVRHLGVKDLAPVFPNFNSAKSPIGLMRA